MSGNVERILKFYEDSTHLLNAQKGKGEGKIASDDLVVNTAASNNNHPKNNNGNEMKIIGEVNRLRTWLQKHQNDIIPESSKSKLFQILESYYAASMTDTTTFTEKGNEAIFNLLNDYLQFPEGKLVGMKEKKKVLSWISKFSVAAGGNGVQSSNTSHTVSEWFAYCDEGGDGGGGKKKKKKKNEFQLMNVQNEEEWKESASASSEDLADTIHQLIEKNNETGDSVIVYFDEELEQIIGIKTEP